MDLTPSDDRSSVPGGGDAAAPRPRKNRPQVVLEVQSRTRITANLMRVVLGGPGLADLADNDFTDKYVKLLLPDPASGLTPPYDLDALRAESPELLPAIRTYTVRDWDREHGHIALDVVLHGDGELDGVAARWADGVLPGDRVAMRGAGGGYAPDPSARFHLLLGDHSALPAIAAALERMAADARDATAESHGQTADGAMPTPRGVAIIQLDHPEDRQELDHPDGIEVHWLVGERERLLHALAELDAPELRETDGVQVFAHGERGIIKQIRRELVRERQIPKDAISISAYWALGRIEDQFQAEKREPIGRIEE